MDEIDFDAATFDAATFDAATFDAATFDAATATDEQLRAYARHGGSLLPLLQAGRARIVDPPASTADAEVPFDADDMAMNVRGVRVPLGLYRQVMQRRHPQGFSGFVRDALTAHLNATPDVDDVTHALAVLQAAAADLQAARAERPHAA